jgi:hypothetical protein
MNQTTSYSPSDFAGKKLYTLQGTQMVLVPTGAPCDDPTLLPVEAYYVNGAGELKRAAQVDGPYVKERLVECELIEN